MRIERELCDSCGKLLNEHNGKNAISLPRDNTIGVSECISLCHTCAIGWLKKLVSQLTQSDQISELQAIRVSRETIERSIADTSKSGCWNRWG